MRESESLCSGVSQAIYRSVLRADCTLMRARVYLLKELRQVAIPQSELEILNWVEGYFE